MVRVAMGAALAVAAAAFAAEVAPVPTPAQSEQAIQRVVRVEIEGLTTLQPEQILPRLRTRSGEPYNAQFVREDLADLARLVRSASVRTEPAPEGGIVVRFVVSEFPRLRRLTTVGNDRLRTARIETLASLKPGDPLDEQTLTRIRNALLEEYRTLGMPQARVALHVTPVPAEPGAPPQADLQIEVEEGRQILCKDVLIEGNRAFSAARLRRIMETKGSWGFVRNYYDSQTFDEDLDRLRDFYAAHGYFDARIERGSFEERQERGRAVVSPVVRIDEGERYRFGSARIRGARLFAHSELLAPFAALEGEPFDGRRFAQALERVRGLYLEHGLLTTEIVPQYEYDEATKRLHMTLEIRERERIYVGRIKLVRPAMEAPPEAGWFRGWYERIAPPVREQAVVREVLLEPGDVYNKRLEQETLRRLANLGVFEEGSLRAYNEPTAEPGVHDLVIEAQDAVTGAISGGVGFGDATGAFIYASYSERNLGGVADTLAVQAMIGARNSAFSVVHFNRRLGESDDSLETRLYYDVPVRPGYRAAIAGTSVELGRPLSADWTTYLRARLEGVRLTERQGFDAEERLDRSYGVATLRWRLVEDTRRPYGARPVEGHLQQIAVEAGYAGGGLVRVEAAREDYVPLSERLTWRIAASAGLMPFSADRLPIHERYFLGGDTDLRGFEFRGAGYFDAREKEIPTGGAIKLLVKNELIFPLFDPVRGVYFIDAGVLARSPGSWQAPRVSTGLGLRFDMRNVQVALDLAVPLIRKDLDRTRYFHFSLQSAF